MCTETVLLWLSETHCQFRLLKRERWPTPWIFLDLVNNQCPILIGSFTLLRSYLTNSVTVYECEPISIQSYFHAIKTRNLFSHSLVDSNKHSWKREKFLKLGGQQLLKIEYFSKRQGLFFNVFHAIHIINKHFILSVSFSKSQCNALSPACQFLFTHYEAFLLWWRGVLYFGKKNR